MSDTDNPLKRLLDATNPESGKIEYDYDENGNVNTVTQARKIPTTTTRFITTTTYDDLNRPVTKSYNDSSATPTVIYCYDGKSYLSGACSGAGTLSAYGQTSAVGNTNGSTNYTFDDQGRVQNLTQRVDTTDRQLSYQYYADNSQAVMTIPGPKNRVTCYDVQGRALWVSGQLTTSDCISGTAVTSANTYGWVSSFASHGAVAMLNFGAASSLQERWCYNARLQTSGLRLGTSGDSSCVYLNGDVFGLRLEYTSAFQSANNGNLMQQFIQMRNSGASAAETRLRQDYQYDAVNRITWAQEFVEAGTGAGFQRGWTYDAVGNLAMNSSSDDVPGGTPTVLTQYEQATNRLKYFKAAAQSGDVMNYDDGGNLTDRPASSGSGRTSYEYDAENRLRKVDLGAAQQNFYDGLGRRVKRVAGGATVTYLYGVGGELVLEYGSPVSTAGVQFLTVDHLGSTRVTTRPDGSVVSRMDFEPFGVEAATTARVADGYAGDPTLRQRFTGKERDAETGLDYFGARYMSAAQGRWTSPDVINLTAKRLVNPSNTLNKYVYAGNNPLKYVDLDGRDITVFYRRGVFDTGHIQLTALSQNTGKVASLDFVPNLDKVKVIQGTVPGLAIPMRSGSDILSEGYASLTIRTTPEEAQKVIQWIEKFQKDTPGFNLLSSNCTTSCVTALQILGVDLDPDTINPDTLWDQLFPKYRAQSALPTLGHYPAQPGQEYGRPRYPGMTTYGLGDLYYRLWLNSMRKEPKACVETSDSATGSKSKQCE